MGGLDLLKAWFANRQEAFQPEGRHFALRPPKGVVLMGIPGCGKSLCAKAVASEWNKPLLRFDLGRVFAGLVGESEERMRKALSVAEGVAPRSSGSMKSRRDWPAPAAGATAASLPGFSAICSPGWKRKPNRSLW